MAYSKTVWVNDNAPALNATNLNKIENGIYDNAEDIDDIKAQIAGNPVLLWSNPSGVSSQTSTMGDSNVTLTQSTEGVKYFIVEFRCFYNVGAKVTCLYFPGTTGVGARVECSRESGNPITMYSRTYYSVDQTTFHFSDCTRYASNAAAVVGQDTGCLVPIRIFMVV